MTRVIGIISGNYRADFLRGMSQDRPIAALPFGGRYRLLDFSLSSMVNSGLRTVGIITPYCYRPVLDHLGAGKAWHLDRKSGGMFILPGTNHGLHARNKRFPLKDFLKNIEFLTKDSAEYVIISACSNIYNIDYTQVLARHEENQADTTLIYKELIPDPEEDDQGMMMETELDGRVIAIACLQKNNKQPVKFFADIMLIKRKLLLDIIRSYEYIEYLDLLTVVAENLGGLKIMASPLKGYFGRIYSIQSYFQRNMEMLQPSVRDELFMGAHRVHTKIKDNPPTRYMGKGTVKDSLVSSGCFIQGEVISSILFREIQVEPGATIKNSIIMQQCVIGKEAVLENVILDKYVQVSSKSVVKGKKGSPVVLDKYSVV